MPTASPRPRHEGNSDHSRRAQHRRGSADGALARHQRANDRPGEPAADRSRYPRGHHGACLSVLLLEGGGRADRAHAAGGASGGAGRHNTPLEIRAKLFRHFRLIGVQGIVRMAIAGLDVACWDALATAAGLPLVRLLGGVPKSVPAYNSNGLGLMAPEAAADEAEALLEGGFRAIKLRLRYPTLDADLAAVRAVRRRLPENILLMADFNQALSVAEAIRRGRALDGEGIYWIEEPIRHDDYPGNAEVAAALATPVQIGENFSGPQAMAAALGAKACDYVMPDLERIGGVRGWQQGAGRGGGGGRGEASA